MQQLAFVAAIVLPLFNIPLIMKIVQRKSSRDISMSWALGVWICLLLMAPSGFASQDPVWKIFNIVNVSMFTAVVFTVLAYRKGRGPDAK